MANAVLRGMQYAGNPHVRKAAVCVLSGIMAAAVFASDWYVDADNGNNAWDGTTAVIPTQAMIDQGGTIPGPRKTLHAMMSDECVVAGDTVWAAEGDYNEGGEVYGEKQTVNRVQVKPGVKLAATGSRDATFITGSGGDYTSGADSAYSNGAARCVYFLAPPDKAEYGCGIVKGFTIRDGRTGSSDEYGGGAQGAGLLVECVFRNNGCRDSTRAGTIRNSTALRCTFTSSNRGYFALSSTGFVIDSLVSANTGHFYSGCKLYNCTFVGNAYLKYSFSYNCLFIGSGAGNSGQKASGESDVAKHYNTFSRTAFHSTACTTNGTCRVVTAEETPYDATTFRPLAGSVAIDAGNMSYYIAATNGWKAAWLAECGNDYYGNDRVVNGAIDVGCGEAQATSSLTISDSSNGLVVTGAAIGTTDIPEGSSIDVTFSRNFTSDRLCTGVEVNGVFHSFGGTTSDVPYSVTFSTTIGGVYNVAAVYETDQKDWYVSPAGDNANKGYHRNCPRRTLDKAMELAAENAGHIVHAAAGVYDEFAEGTDARSRVNVKAGVGLVADDWPLQETVIQGASDTTSGEADKNGNGPKAVRCVYVNSGGYVRGFKLTGGRTVIASSGNTGNGGGAILSSGALIDCEVTGNGCSYRGRAVNGGTIIRCYIHDQVCGNYDVNGGIVVDSYVKGNGTSSFAYYGSGRVLNSIILNGDMRSSDGKIRAINSYLRKVSGPSSSGVFCTNCVFTLAASDAIPANSSYDPDTCSFEAATDDNLDDDFRPKTALSPLVDAGSKELYDANFPASWVQFKGRDLKNGQRVYNGQIDVGCGEYDCRADFERFLGQGAVISAMGPGVTTNSVPKIVVPEGDSIILSMQPKQSGKTLYRLVYTPDGGSEVVFTEKSEDPFLYTLDGACTVQSLDRYSCSGFTVVFR